MATRSDELWVEIRLVTEPDENGELGYFTVTLEGHEGSSRSQLAEGLYPGSYDLFMADTIEEAEEEAEAWIEDIEDEYDFKLKIKKERKR